MKKILLLFITQLLSLAVFAQVPTYFNTNVAGGGNSFPLNNSTTSRKVTWFIPANNLGLVPAGNNITDIYFQAGSTATRTYPVINIRMKVGIGTGLTGIAGGPVEGGLTTVYTSVNQTISSTIGSWIKFTLQTPFLYDPAQPLVVELEHNSTSGTGPTLYQAVAIPGPGNGRQWADFNGLTNTGSGNQSG
ncbi:MAG: hypothetical protein IPJ31_16520 [Bacteroidetes bacterium]|nr:hypothetical protein [Bacteroidota bacterium]